METLNPDLIGKSNEDLRHLIRWTELKAEAGQQLLQQSPTNEDLRHLIRWTELKAEAGAQLLTQMRLEPINESLLIRELAGWACVLNPTANAVEANFDTHIAGMLALPSYVQLFFEENEKVLSVLKSIAQD